VGRRQPSLIEYARAFRIRQVVELLQMIETADAALRKKYRSVAASLRSELCRELGTVLGNKVFHGRRKLDILLMIAGVYRPFRHVYYKLSGRTP
jgi:hypothetical protein